MPERAASRVPVYTSPRALHKLEHFAYRAAAADAAAQCTEESTAVAGACRNTDGAAEDFAVPKEYVALGILKRLRHAASSAQVQHRGSDVQHMATRHSKRHVANAGRPTPLQRPKGAADGLGRLQVYS